MLTKKFIQKYLKTTPNFKTLSSMSFKNFSDSFKNNNEVNKEKQEDEYTSFGYQNVKKEERQSKVNSVFSNVAKR